MKRWTDAAEWFLAGTHKAFASLASVCSAKCLRKASLCYIEQREYAHASRIINQCPTNQSSTYYLLFLSAVHQGENSIVTVIVPALISSTTGLERDGLFSISPKCLLMGG